MKKIILPLLVLAWLSHADEKRVYYIGNSLTDELKYDAFEKLCAARDHKLVWGRHMIPGAPISWLWNHPKDGFTKGPFGATETAFNYQWDVVTLQPFSTFDVELEHAIKYVNRIKEKGPDAQIYVYAQWPTKRHRDWSAMWLQDYRKKEYPSPNHSRSFYEAFVTALREKVQTNKPIKLIPVGHVMHLMHQKMQAGQVPGYRDAFELYSDGVHVSNVASYIVGCTFYTVIHGESPVGLPVVPGYAAEPAAPDDHFAISPELAKIIQETTWEVVATHSMTGVTGKEALKVATPALPNAIEGEPYRFELQAAFGPGPYKWSIEQGTLPQGMTLDPAGIIGGVAAAPSQFPVTIGLTDAKGAKASRGLRLTVEKDVAPKVQTGSLSSIKRGAYVRLPLKAEGGNGQLTWSVKGGRIPLGLELEADGAIVGSTGEEGDVEFTLEVADGDPGKAEKDSKTYTLHIEPAAGDVLMVRFAEKPPVLDGKLDSGEWNLANKVEKRVEGEAANNKVAFDARWDKSKLYVGVRIWDEKVAAPPKGKDAVEIYIDGLNNREGTYNFDDRRIVIYPDGKRDPKLSVIGAGYRVNCKGGPVEGGYFVEMGIDFGDFGAKGAHNNSVFGLDIMNVDDDGDGKISKVVWQGTKDDATDPSHFGTIILTGAPAQAGKK